MDHTSNQPTLVHAKFLVSVFKKGIELAGEMPKTGEILMILLENISRLNPFGTSWLIYFCSVYPFLSRHFPLIWLGKHDETPGRHWGIIIPAETIEICVHMKMVYNPQLLPFI